MAWYEIIGLFLSSGVVAGVVTAVLNRRKTKSEVEKNEADAAQTIADAATGLIEPLKKQIIDLQTRLNEITCADQAKQRQIDDLEKNLNEVRVTVEKLSVEATLKDQRIAKLTRENVRLEKDNVEKSRLILELQNRVTELEAEVKRLTDRGG